MGNQSENQKKGDDRTFIQRLFSVAGASSTIGIITLSLEVLDLIPKKILIGMGIFSGLPVIYSFIFGLIHNKPNFSVIRKYGFLFYLFLSGVAFFLLTEQDNFLEIVNSIYLFLSSLLLSLIAYGLYFLGFNFKKSLDYRWKALIGLGLSLSFLILIIVILNSIDAFNLVDMAIQKIS